MRHVVIVGLVAGLLTSQIEATALHVHLSDHGDNHGHGLAAHDHEIAAHISSDFKIGAFTPEQDRVSVSLATVLIKKMQAPSALLARRVVVVIGQVASPTMNITDVRAHGPPHRATRLLRAPPAIRPA